MKKNHVILASIIIAAIGLAAYTTLQNNTITPEEALTIATKAANPPEEALFLGVKLLNTSNQHYLASWKITYKALQPKEGMLIEVQLTRKGEILNIINYPLAENEYMANISKILAYHISEEALKNNVNTPSSHNIGIPDIYYSGKTWDATWEKKLGDYIIPAATFRVKVDANTGEVTSIDNRLDTVPNITPPKEINVTRENAVEIAENHLLSQLTEGYQAENTRVRGETRTEQVLIEYPRNSGQYRPAWAVITRLDYIREGEIITVGASATVDAQTGKVIKFIFG